MNNASSPWATTVIMIALTAVLVWNTMPERQVGHFNADAEPAEAGKDRLRFSGVE